MPVKGRGTVSAVKYEVREYETDKGRSPYDEWLSGLRDRHGQAKIRTRINRVKLGNFGEHKGVGEGVMELVFRDGPGYRVYYGLDGDKVVILLGGGDKKTQDSDIRQAKEYWADYWR